MWSEKPLSNVCMLETVCMYDGRPHRQYTRSDTALKSSKESFDWGWGDEWGGTEGKEDRRLESSPCSLWQSEQEALSKVSVHFQKAAAKLQATARWLYGRVRESRGALPRVKGLISNLDFQTGEIEGRGPLLFFAPKWRVWANSGLGWTHHLAADWDCVAMIMWEGPLSALGCWPIPASTDIAMASAAALELRPFCPTEGLGAKELCWITGAGEPVGSEVSFMLSSAATKSKLTQT